MKEILLDKNLLKSVVAMASVVEARDAYTGGHIWRVSQYAKRLAEKASLSQGEILQAELGGLIHDIGKIGISDNILNKNEKLSDEEYLTIKTHTSIGKHLIADHPLKEFVADAVYMHHERIDGKGYPENIPESELSPVSRILAITDAFDAMTSTRSYRKAMNVDAAVNIIYKERGKQFDKALADIFIDLAKSGVINDIVGYCGYEKPMLVCPGCGPIIAYSKDARNGDAIVCPCCKGEFTMHKSNLAFEIECNDRRNFSYFSQPDKDTIEAFIQAVPYKSYV